MGTWDYRVAIATLAGVMIHGACDIMNDIYDVEIDKICKPKGMIVSGQIPVKIAWVYMGLLFAAALAISLWLSPVLFACFLAGIVVGGVMYSHPLFRFKDLPGVAMLDMAVCFSLESIGIWSLYAPVDSTALLVAAYVFILTFCLTFMKDFKDVAGDVSSLPLLLGTGRAARVCCVLALLPIVPLMYLALQYHFLVLAIVVYLWAAIRCITVLLGDPVKEGVKLKGRMITALTVPNFVMLLTAII
ncbi:UbiA family prenyltransferase [Methanocella arvoryzae]|nr:UbiA family prenyltransferase [Methanocella arvoryzae]